MAFPSLWWWRELLLNQFIQYLYELPIGIYVFFPSLTWREITGMREEYVIPASAEKVLHGFAPAPLPFPTRAPHRDINKHAKEID